MIEEMEINIEKDRERAIAIWSTHINLDLGLRASGASFEPLVFGGHRSKKFENHCTRQHWTTRNNPTLK